MAQTEKAMAPHSSTLAWKIPWTEDPGRLQSMGSRRVGHDFTFTFHFSLSCIGEGNGNPLQCSCLENPRDGGAWWNLKRLSSSSSSSSDSNGKESACCVGDMGSIPGSGRSRWRRKWHPNAVFLPGESHGQRSLVGYNP